MKRNIRAAVPRFYNAPRNGVIVPLELRWAEEAWADGACNLPPAEECIRLPDFETLPLRPLTSGMHANYRYVADTESLLFGVEFKRSANESVEVLLDTFSAGFPGAWLLASQGVRVPRGCTIREPDDLTRGDAEVVIYTDGRLRG